MKIYVILRQHRPWGSECSCDLTRVDHLVQADDSGIVERYVARLQKEADKHDAFADTYEFEEVQTKKIE